MHEVEAVHRGIANLHRGHTVSIDETRIFLVRVLSPDFPCQNRKEQHVDRRDEFIKAALTGLPPFHTWT